MTEHTGERLATVLARLQRAFIANGKQVDSELEDGKRLAERAERLEALERAGHPLPITPAMQDAIVRGALSRTYALTAALEWRDNAPGSPLPRKPGVLPSRPILVLHGVTGSGKSVAAAAVLAQTPGARWASGRTLLECYVGSFGETLQRRAVLQTSKLLVLDGIGDERPDRADSMADALLDMLAHRTHRRTILTTRMTDTLFAKRYSSPPLSSLFVESADLIAIPTGDMRKGAP
jgi:hypothetical protein